MKLTKIFYKKILKNIKALVVDVDGTLTDGGMYYGENGETLKKFNTKDGQGLVLLKQKGLIVCVITAEDSPRVHTRMKKLSIDEYYAGVKNKLPLLKELCTKWSISIEQVAYVGDDFGDLECLQNVGFSAIPADAERVVRGHAKYRCKRVGGGGAVREVCDLIYETQYQ